MRTDGFSRRSTAPIPAFLRQLAEKEHQEPTDLPVGAVHFAGAPSYVGVPPYAEAPPFAGAPPFTGAISKV